MILKQNYLEYKKKILEKEFKNMNPMQKEAIFTVKGPLLILAGAGSGKTTVIVNRIAYLLRHGNAYYSDNMCENLTNEDIEYLKKQVNPNEPLDESLLNSYILKENPPKPWQILAITFTNKASNELCDRLSNLLGEDSNNINAGTFHSECIRILRFHIDRLNYQNNFTIYDTEDSKRVIKDALSNINLSDKIYTPKSVLNKISNAKNRLLSPKQFEAAIGEDFYQKEISKIYEYYQNHLKSANALDFDDIIYLTVSLLENNPDILEKYQNKFKYILVDEYQDTNCAQYKLVALLAGKHHNICVVGDDDQSIYKFRGATIENILNFEKQMENVKVIRLEENYRSTQNILSAANSVIANNSARKGKNLWTSKGEGEKLKEIHISNENEEAELISNTINNNISSGMSYSDHVILYRTNAQSANIERFLVRHAIPYRIIGGTKFYDRKEIKDVLSYLSVLNNKDDNLRLLRIINEPKRGIGSGTVAKLQEIADEMGKSVYYITSQTGTFNALKSKSVQIDNFYNMMEQLRLLTHELTLPELFDEVLKKTRYIDSLKEQGVQAQTRIENIEELKTNLIQYEEQNENATLSGFLEEISLYTDIDEYNSSDDKVALMTLHSAKGLEFPVVFMTGMEEGLFPGNKADTSLDELEEERRLAYVGITRAKKQLYLISAAQRMIFGSTRYSKPSRFLNEIPEDYKDVENAMVTKMPSTMLKRNKLKVNINNIDKHKNNQKTNVDFNTNDMVLHSIFGKGIVISITPMGNDNLIEVDFEKKGKKKIMANYAKIKKI